MEEKECNRIIAEVNKEHNLDLDIYSVFDAEYVTEQEFRRMCLRAGGIEAREEIPIEEEVVDISQIRDIPTLSKMATAQRRAREEKEKADFLSRREKKLRRLRAAKK